MVFIGEAKASGLNQNQGVTAPGLEPPLGITSVAGP